MIHNFFRYETLLYIAAFFLALALRLAQIGNLPLDNSEAALALQALALSNGEAIVAAPHPLYLNLTAVWMFLFGSGQWIARFWPAVAGSLLVICPALFRDLFGKTAALLLAFLLAFDPGMSAVSRQAGGPALALLFLVIFTGLVIRREVAWAGIAAGMAVLSGPGIWMGLISLGLAFLASRWPGIYGEMGKISGNRPGEFIRFYIGPEKRWNKFLWYVLGTIFFAGTLFFFFPSGLSAMAGGIPAYLQTWAVPSGIPASRLIVSVVVYEFFLLFPGIWGAINGLTKKDTLDSFLAIWWLAALLLAVIQPGRLVTDLDWSILPLAVLAARQLERIVNIAREDRLPTLGQLLLSTMVLGFLSLTALSMVNNPQYLNEREYWIRLLGAFVMIVASVALIAWGWSKEVSLRGFALGCMVIFSIYSISSTWNAAHLSGKKGFELWENEVVLADEQLLRTTIDQVYLHSPAIRREDSITVAGITAPALKWILRVYSGVEFTSQVPIRTTPSFVITQNQSDFAFSVPYRGQDFVLRQSVKWELLNAQQWLRWLAFRVVPEEAIVSDRVILWAKTDLFPEDGTVSQQQLPANEVIGE